MVIASDVDQILLRAVETGVVPGVVALGGRRRWCRLRGGVREARD